MTQVSQQQLETGHCEASGRPRSGHSLSRVVGYYLIAAIFSFGLSLVYRPFVNLTSFFLYQQDRWLLLAGALTLVTALIRPERRAAPLNAGIGSLFATAVALLLICLAGHYFVLAGYDMSRDEQMASFDAAIFAGGRLVQEIPALWRDHSDALNTLFMQPAEHRSAWISAYLPVNAALRALIGTIATPALTGPLMTAMGALALWGCARRIWPQDREAPIVALLLYIGSAQVLVTGMTAYAMPVHLALNLAWLWLFLHRKWPTDVAALIVGFAAVGLHQPVMHPMFAGPLLCLLLIEKQWRRAAFYAAGYAAICMFWLWWPNWISPLVQASADTLQPNAVGYGERLTALLLQGDPRRLPNMAANLLRFMAWQHLLLLPLLLLGFTVARKDRLAGALLTGVLLTTCVMALILPYQGHGFGYRYLHGLIGNCILLAIYGWKSLGATQGKWRDLLLRASAAGGVLLLPLQLWMVHAFYAPVVEANARIDAIDADYVVISRGGVPFSADLAHNPPTLDIRPIRLIGGENMSDIASAICRDRPSIVLVGDRLLDRINAYYGLPAPYEAARRNAILAPRLEAAGCRVERLP